MRRLSDPRDDTKSFGLSVGSFVRSVRQHKAIPWLLNNLLKGLILRQEVEDREEGNEDWIAVL